MRWRWSVFMCAWLCALTFPPSFPAAPGKPCSPGTPGAPGWPRSPVGPDSPDLPWISDWVNHTNTDMNHNKAGGVFHNRTDPYCWAHLWSNNPHRSWRSRLPLESLQSQKKVGKKHILVCVCVCGHWWPFINSCEIWPHSPALLVDLGDLEVHPSQLDPTNTHTCMHTEPHRHKHKCQDKKLRDPQDKNWSAVLMLCL